MSQCILNSTSDGTCQESTAFFLPFHRCRGRQLAIPHVESDERTSKLLWRQWSTNPTGREAGPLLRGMRDMAPPSRTWNFWVHSVNSWCRYMKKSSISMFMKANNGTSQILTCSAWISTNIATESSTGGPNRSSGCPKQFVPTAWRREQRRYWLQQRQRTTPSCSLISGYSASTARLRC